MTLAVNRYRKGKRGVNTDSPRLETSRRSEALDADKRGCGGYPLHRQCREAVSFQAYSQANQMGLFQPGMESTGVIYPDRFVTHPGTDCHQKRIGPHAHP